MPDLSKNTDLIAQTLSYYDEHAAQFWEGTRDHDVTQNYAALLEAIEGEPPFDLLDLGCGPGRDLKYFMDCGHKPVGLDGSAEFVKLARSYSGAEVLHQDFLSLDLPERRFDGIFANATLFHVPFEELPRVLGDLHLCLRERGVLFVSIPRGNGEQGLSRGRFGAYHREDEWRQYCENAGFVLLRDYYRPEGKPRSEQPWYASVWRKPG